ncbi:nucleotidyltransferase domain-containing protein [uncultured Adlercreutzia sp.]|uniref:nucleotidyltransferase family protein n=1 Tax=uncultured Adlercreutzia sp. TaxID=875803 RepID=UPI0025E399FB|nr:nucleotidyltransferase domain-containing protein [uncultured Adlercreutzia sp.]
MLTLSSIETAIRDVASEFDISRVYLFGSYARGTANEQSDVDLCLETGPTFSLFSAGAFSQSLGHALNVPIDMTTEASLYDFVKDQCLKDRILLYERI